MSSPAPLGMFIIGFIIFALYLWGLLTMIYRSHRQQRRELENDPELKAYYKKLRDEDDYIAVSYTHLTLPTKRIV